MPPKPYRLIIAGGRDFHNYDALLSAIEEWKQGGAPATALQKGGLEIVSGMAGGADSLGARYAKETGLALHPYPARWDDINTPGARIRRNARGPYNANAGFDRNTLMAANADGVLLLPGGTGTAHMAAAAAAAGIDSFDFRRVNFKDASPAEAQGGFFGEEGSGMGPYPTFEIVSNKGPYDVLGMRKPGTGLGMSSVPTGELGWLGNDTPANDTRYGTVPRADAVAAHEEAFLKRVETDPDFRQAILGLRGKAVGYYKPDEPDIHLHPVQRWLSNQPDTDDSPLPQEPTPAPTPEPTPIEQQIERIAAIDPPPAAGPEPRAPEPAPTDPDRPMAGARWPWILAAAAGLATAGGGAYALSRPPAPETDVQTNGW
jgi:hypothetical protein